LLTRSTAIEISLAILVSALAGLTLPRRRVRQYLSTAKSMGRFQYWLLVIPNFVLAVVLWIDLWRRFRDHTGNETFAWIIAGAALWGTVLAATRLPEIFSGRASQKAPPGYPYGDAAYRAALRAGPTTIVAAFLLVAGFVAGLVSGFLGVGLWIFVGLFTAGLAASLVALIVALTGWPKLLIPPALRPSHGRRRRTPPPPDR
jgi:hypothetical protein